MKCDLCGKYIDPGHSRSSREVPDSRVCEECYKAVTATGEEEKGTVTSVQRTPGSDRSPKAAGERCERCGRPWINSGPCPACDGERYTVTTPLPGPRTATPPEGNALVSLFIILGKIALGLIAAVILLFVVMFIVCMVG